MDPSTAMLALSAVGTVASVAGAQQTSQANSNAAAYQAQVARNNQVVAEQNAKYAEEVGASQVQAKQQQTAQMQGRIRAALGGAGVDPNSGSAARLQESTAEMGTLDAETIRNNAARQAYGFRVQGTDFASQAGMLDAQSKNALTAGNLNMFGSLVSGASSFAEKWNKWKSPTDSSAGWVSQG